MAEEYGPGPGGFHFTTDEEAREERRAKLLEAAEVGALHIPPFLERALDNHLPEGWHLVWVQHELGKDDPVLVFVGLLAQLTKSGQLETLGLDETDRRRRFGLDCPEHVSMAFEEFGAKRRDVQSVRMRLARLQAHINYLDSLGLHFDFTDRHVRIPTDGRSRRFVRSLVAAMESELRTQGPDRGQPKARLELMASVLGPLLGPDWSETGKGSPLRNAYDNV